VNKIDSAAGAQGDLLLASEAEFFKELAAPVATRSKYRTQWPQHA
jgi:hypothetical protein